MRAGGLAIRGVILAGMLTGIIDLGCASAMAESIGSMDSRRNTAVNIVNDEVTQNSESKESKDSKDKKKNKRRGHVAGGKITGIYDKVVAATGDYPILLSEIEQKLTTGPLVLLSSYPASEQDTPYKRALHDAINFSLLAMKAEILEIEVTDEDVDKQIARILASQKATKADLEIFLQSQNLTIEDYEEDLADQILIQKVQARVIAPGTRLSDQRVREEYQKRFNSSPEDVSLTLVQVTLIDSAMDPALLSPKEAITEVYHKVKSRKLSYEDLRADSRLQLSAERQVFASDLAGNIASVLAATGVGEISSPVKLSGEWNLMLVVAKTEALKPHFVEQQPKLLHELRMKDMERSLVSWLAAERKNHKIVISSGDSQNSTKNIEN